MTQPPASGAAIGGRLRAARQARGLTLQQVAAGDAFAFPSREPHTWSNATTGATEVVWVLAPAP
ncbi:cupin domain-containing protein [Actinoplanes philippinensis]|uniref:cupin domain-containing protein n=1 Tax=Actinoplanes philippinensis TaxID=35752 RepID=UPI0033FB41A3